jgi:hypothetical protein
VGRMDAAGGADCGRDSSSQLARVWRILCELLGRSRGIMGAEPRRAKKDVGSAAGGNVGGRDVNPNGVPADQLCERPGLWPLPEPLPESVDDTDDLDNELIREGRWANPLLPPLASADELLGWRELGDRDLDRCRSNVGDTAGGTPPPEKVRERRRAVSRHRPTAPRILPRSWCEPSELVLRSSKESNEVV